MPFDHNCNHAQCDHEPTTDDASEWNLNTRIDLENLQCLNEEIDGSCKKIFRSWDDRLNREYIVKSDDEQELLINIPFSGSVKLKSIVVIGANDETHPAKIKLFKNKPFMTFDQITVPCEQEIELIQDPDGLIAYPLKPVKFSSVTHLSIYIEKNFSDDEDTSTEVYFIGLKGDFISAHRQQVVITNYESKPNLADHKTDINQTVFRGVM